jgi:two-component system, LytTR family, sensor kinase
MGSIIYNKTYRISIGIVVIIIATIQFGAQYYLSQNLNIAILNAVILGFCFLASFLLIGNNLHYYRPKNFNFSYLIGWCILFGLICFFVPKLVFSFFTNLNQSKNEISNSIIYINLVFNFLVLACYSAISVIWYHQNETLENQLRAQEAQSLNREAELYKLRQQLQPHFLFNSLNSINALIGARPTEARKMVMQLSDFLRYTIKKEDNELVTFAEEIANLELYLEIEKVRFGHRLTTDFNLEEAAKAAKIPVLLLQPILENAIKFGLYDTLDEVNISIEASIEANNLCIQITNPFDAKTNSQSKGTGFGLASVRKRLELIFFMNGLLVTNANENIFTTQITIPQKI